MPGGSGGVVLLAACFPKNHAAMLNFILTAGAVCIPGNGKCQRGSTGSCSHATVLPVSFLACFRFMKQSPSHAFSLFRQEPEDVPSQEKCSVRQQGEDFRPPQLLIPL
jgi:hypothetical protein